MGSNDNSNIQVSGKYTENFESQLEPDNANAYCIRGIACFNNGDYDLAIADYTKAVNLDGDNARAYCARGNAYFKKGDYDHAIADYTRSISLDEDDASVHYIRGCAWERSGNKKNALADFEAAVRLDPNDKQYQKKRDALKGGGLRKVVKFAIGLGAGAVTSEIIGSLLTRGKNND